MSSKKLIPVKDFHLFCEDIREERGGKYSLLGAFVGGDISIPAGSIKDQLSLSGLSIFAQFSNGDGEYRHRLVIVAPSGAKVVELDAGTVEMKLNVPHLANLQMKPFPLPELGKYQIEYYLDDQKYLFEIVVQQGKLEEK